MIPAIIKTINHQLIMPCFCAGANPETPELRAASFRGELRWWFRCLGGTREQEKAVFGGIQGGARSSAVAILVLNVSPAPNICEWKFEKVSDPECPNSAYITYFLTARKKTPTNRKIERKREWLAPGMRFTLELRQLRPIRRREKELLCLAWDCLCNLGSIGARKTRALGAYAPVNPEEQIVTDLLSNYIVKKNFQLKLLEEKTYGDFCNGKVVTSILTDCARILKDYRQSYEIHPAKGKQAICRNGKYYGASALGNAIGVRQASIVRFRPVLLKGKLHLCILKAPDITLGAAAKHHNIDSLSRFYNK